MKKDRSSPNKKYTKRNNIYNFYNKIYQPIARYIMVKLKNVKNKEKIP